MRVIERRIGAHTHEFLRADLDDRDAGIVVEVRNDMVGHSIHLELAMKAVAINTTWQVEMPRTILAGIGDSQSPQPLICSCKFDTILSSQRSPSFVGAVVS
jgi:hypothetical protein